MATIIATAMQLDAEQLRALAAEQELTAAHLAENDVTRRVVQTGADAFRAVADLVDRIQEIGKPWGDDSDAGLATTIGPPV